MGATALVPQTANAASAGTSADVTRAKAFDTSLDSYQSMSVPAFTCPVRHPFMVGVEQPGFGGRMVPKGCSLLSTDKHVEHVLPADPPPVQA